MEIATRRDIIGDVLHTGPIREKENLRFGHELMGLGHALAAGEVVVKADDCLLVGKELLPFRLTGPSASGPGYGRDIGAPGHEAVHLALNPQHCFGILGLPGPVQDQMSAKVVDIFWSGVGQGRAAVFVEGEFSIFVVDRNHNAIAKAVMMPGLNSKFPPDTFGDLAAGKPIIYYRVEGHESIILLFFSEKCQIVDNLGQAICYSDIVLYEHQRKIIDADPKRAGLFLGTGGGKTRTALALAFGRTLVICPKTQKEDGNWQRELVKMNKKLDLTVLSKETFKRDSSILPRFDTVIIDEAHTVCGVTPNVRYRNRIAIPRASQIFEATYGYLRRTRPERVYLCTATPARNPMTVWAAAELLGVKWPSWEAWRENYYVKLPMPGREVWQARKDAKSKRDLAYGVSLLGYVGRLNDWFDVPPQIDKVVKCPLDKGQEEVIKSLPIEYPDPLVLIGKIHQAEQGESKILAVEDLFEEFGKVLVFARYRVQIDALAEHFSKKTTVYTLTGDTKKRSEVIRDAEKAEAGVIIVQAQIATGFELPSVNCVIFASMSYSFVDHEQSKGRVLRANKLGKKLYVYLISGEIDGAVLKCIENHKDFSEQLYAQARSGISNKIQPLAQAIKGRDRRV